MERALRKLFAYNIWANARVFDICCGVEQASLQEPAPGTHGTIMETLKHLVTIEVAFSHMLREEPPDLEGPWKDFNAHDLAWFAERVAQASRDYTELLGGASDAFFEEPLHVPWFDFALTKHDGLLQVLSHSAHHRAQVFSALGARGVAVPDLDYVILVENTAAEQRPLGTEPSTLVSAIVPTSPARRRWWPWQRRTAEM
jgi:uncharacterized damage-inducible protein DinB